MVRWTPQARTLANNPSHVALLVYVVVKQCSMIAPRSADDDLAHAQSSGLPHDREDFVASEVAGRENHPMFRDPIEACPHGGTHPSIGVERRKRWWRDVLCGEISLNHRPER
jgi:hypothetical protein